jgi:hypothetical protein
METLSTSEAPVNFYLTVQSHSLEYVIQRSFTNTAVEIRHADHVTPFLSRSIGIVCSRTQATEFVFFVSVY